MSRSSCPLPQHLRDQTDRLHIPTRSTTLNIRPRICRHHNDHLLLLLLLLGLLLLLLLRVPRLRGIQSHTLCTTCT